MQSSLRDWSLHRSLCLAACALAASLAPARVHARAQAEPAATGAGSAAPAPTLGAPEQRVLLLVRTRGDDAAIARLRFELVEGGFRILELPSDTGLEAEPLAGLAAREHVAAAVRVDAARGRVELWVRDEGGGIEETFSAGAEASSGHVLAVRVAEALRARGLLLPPAPERAGPAASDAAPPLPARRREPRAPPPASPAPEPARASTRLSLELGPGLVVSPGGLGPSAVVELGLRLELGRVWSVALLGGIPLSRSSLAEEEGEALVASTLAAALLELELARLPFGGVRAGLGAGAVVTAMSGRGSEGFRGADDTVTAFAPLARGSFHVDLATRLRLRAALAGGITLPEVQVAFATRAVATWGQPFVLAGLALEVTLF